MKKEIIPRRPTTTPALGSELLDLLTQPLLWVAATALCAMYWAGVGDPAHLQPHRRSVQETIPSVSDPIEETQEKSGVRGLSWGKTRKSRLPDPGTPIDLRGR